MADAQPNEPQPAAEPSPSAPVSEPSDRSSTTPNVLDLFDGGNQADKDAELEKLRKRRERKNARERARRRRLKESKEAEAAQRTPEEQKRVEEQRQYTEEQLANALSATVEGLCDGVAALKYRDVSVPRFGRARANTIGEAWAPILKPYIDESNAPMIQLCIATGFTANALIGFAAELKEHGAKQRPARPVVVEAKLETQTKPTPAPEVKPPAPPPEPKARHDDPEGIRGL